MKTQDYIKLSETFGARNYKPLDVVIERGEGVWVYDIEGNRYLDCLSAYGALNQGHVHPKILKTLIDQAQKLTLTSRAFRNDQLPFLYKELCELTGYEMAITMNSGAEAVETAIKIARKWAYKVKKVEDNKAEIIVADGNFHGRTVTIVSFSSEDLYKKDFGPFTPGFVNVAYSDVNAIEKAINMNTAAVMLEPIQGEGGVIIPPENYLKQVSEICRKHNVLFIADEIQTGLGRTGKLFACDYEGVRPDVMIIGKALAGGFYPVSAVLSDRQVLGLFNPGEHGSTFGGNPLGAAVARTALKVITEENLVGNSYKMGEYFTEQLHEMPQKNIKEIRARGLLIGVEIKKDSGKARSYCEALQKKGILAKETHETTIRFAPPLIIDRETIDWALPKIKEILSK
ncbi:MAG: ornithine--oxo-acid transaminase [Pelolinea sp.]|nr:ornithine--oxo-acid transaminase [Pelolinea sp.]